MIQSRFATLCLLSVMVCSIRESRADKAEMLDLTQQAIALPSNEQAKKIDLYTKAIQSYKGFYLPWTNRAVCYLNYGRWDNAIADATEAINLAPEDPHAWGVRGRAYAGKRQFEQAFRDLSRALNLAKTSEEKRNLLNDRGNAYFSARKYEEAIKDYQRSVEIDPAFAQGYNNLGIAYRAIGDMDRAIVSLNTSLKHDAVSPRAFVNRARVFTARNDPMMAIADYDRAVALDADDASALLNRGMFLFINGQKVEALADFEASLRVDSQNPYAAIWRYIAQSALGTKDAAKAELQKFVGSQKGEAWPLPIAKMLIGQASPEDVLKLAPLSDDEPRSKERLAEAHYYLGEYYRLMGDDSKGKAELAQAVNQAVPRSQEYILATVALDGWKSPTPPPPKSIIIND
jgi:lipoprotein NlpI